jgi:uridine phosphorylase
MLSEADLILNQDGSIYHLRLRPGDLADTVLLVGDPKRVSQISRHFDKVEIRRNNREFITHTGFIGSDRITVMSTGIGPDNIDIVMNEIDALVNVDFITREEKDNKKKLAIIRMGTSGSIQPGISTGSMVLATHGLGLDGSLSYYKDIERVSEPQLQEQFIQQSGWPEFLPAPHIIEADPGVTGMLDHGAHKGIMASAAGFYAPQGRKIRLGLAFPGMLSRIAVFESTGLRVLNFEMETATIYGLARLLGHRAASICVILANRIEGTYTRNSRKDIDKLIEYTLEWITK